MAFTNLGARMAELPDKGCKYSLGHTCEECPFPVDEEGACVRDIRSSLGRLNLIFKSKDEIVGPFLSDLRQLLTADSNNVKRGRTLRKKAQPIRGICDCEHSTASVIGSEIFCLNCRRPIHLSGRLFSWKGGNVITSTTPGR